MNKTDTVHKKIEYVGNCLNTNHKQKNSKIPHYKINSLLEQKKMKQNMITQIEAIIHNLEELKANEKIREKIIHLNENIIYYEELIIFYRKGIQNMCDVLKSQCDHVVVKDLIDISPDESQIIIYCEKCETTF